MFVSGHPGNTDRLLTAAQLEVQRDTFMPFWLMRFSELRGRMIQYSKTGEEPRRTAESYLNQIENSIKVRRKQFDALLDPALIAAAREKEQALGSAAASFEQVAKAQDAWRNILVPYTFIESGAAFNSQLFQHARTLVRAAAERAKPNEARLPEFTEARLPAVVQGLGADTPIYPEFEALRLSFGLERMREWLGPDDPVVRQVFGKDSPDALAEPRGAAEHARQRRGAHGAVRGRAGRDRREPGPDDPARGGRGPGGARAAQDVRDRGRGPGGPRPGRDREGALREVRHQHLPGRDVHAAPVIRVDAGLGRERPAGAPVDRAVARIRARDRRAAVQSPAALDGAEGQPRHDDAGELHDQQRHRRRQLGQPDAERARARSWGSPSTATSTRSRAVTGSTSG